MYVPGVHDGAQMIHVTIDDGDNYETSSIIKFASSDSARCVVIQWLGQYL